MHKSREEKIEIKYKGDNFMKRILKLILTGILLFCTIFSIVGCGEETGNSSSNTESVTPKPTIPLKEGEFYSLEEAYERGWLTEEALEGIADIYNNKKDCAYVAGDLPLSIENSIKHTYLEDLREDVPQAKIENVELRKYYGTYGDCIVVNIYSRDMLCDIRFEDTYIGDVLFVDFGGKYSITVWVVDK